MRESAEFLASLEHDNPGRPVFRIVPAVVDTQLEISFHGQRMLLPIAEVLHFAVRWQADQDMQRAAKAPHTTLRIHPYPIFGARMIDSDVPGLD